MSRATEPMDVEGMVVDAPDAEAAANQQAAAPARSTAGLIDRLGWRGFGRNVWLLLIYTLGKGFQISIGAVTINLYVYSLGYKQDFVGWLDRKSTRLNSS